MSKWECRKCCFSVSLVFGTNKFHLFQLCYNQRSAQMGAKTSNQIGTGALPPNLAPINSSSNISSLIGSRHLTSASLPQNTNCLMRKKLNTLSLAVFPLPRYCKAGLQLRILDYSLLNYCSYSFFSVTKTVIGRYLGNEESGVKTTGNFIQINWNLKKKKC